MTNLASSSQRTVKLPPLILHPFADNNGPARLVESSRASLMMQGFLPNREFSPEDLDRVLLDGRMCEIQMLYYVGKDLLRWMEQCLEVVARDAGVRGFGLGIQNFATLLIDNTPPIVKEKLTRWGVVDYRAIFSRAIALNILFAEAPTRELLGGEFIRHYYRFADQVYQCHRSIVQPPVVANLDFEFDLFASGEYSRMLEREWEDQ